MSLSAKSLLAFATCLVLLLLYTLLDPVLAPLPPSADRLIIVLFLVVPAVVGVALGVNSLRRREPRSWLAIVGIALNGLFALFHLLIVAYAG